jgi:transcription termination factor Rho
LLLSEKELNRVWLLRKVLQPMGTVDAMEFLLEKIRQTKTNANFLDSMNT